MKKFVKKLNSRRGASIVIALLIFMLCALGGASALIMAAANAGRYSHADEERQSYYSVTSAALLMVDLLEGLNYTSPLIEHTYTHRWDYDDKTDPNDPVRNAVDSYSLNILDMKADRVDGHLPLIDFDLYEHPTDSKGNVTNEYRMQIPKRTGETDADRDLRHAVEAGDLVRAILLQCDKIVPYLSVPEEWYSSVEKGQTLLEGAAKTTPESFHPSDLNYTFTIAPSKGEFAPVEARLVMSANYDLIFSFTCRSGEGGGYAVNLYWEATVDETAEKGEPKYSYLEDGSWASIEIKDSKYVKISWERSQVTISRGEAAEEGTI